MRCRRWGRILAAWILLSFVSPAAANSHFRIDDGRLLLDGNPFVARGVVYGNVPIGARWSDTVGASECLYGRDFPLIARLGANTIRTLAMVPGESRVFVRSLEANGLYWIAGFPLDRFFNSAQSLSDDSEAGRELRGRILGEFRSYVEAWKDEPQLLAFVFGNEVDSDYPRKFGGSVGDFFSLLNEAAALAADIAPEVLITSSLADPGHIGAFNLGTTDARQPFVSFWSLHVPGRAFLGEVLNELRTRTSKPYLISSFGVDAYDAATQSENSAGQSAATRGLAREIGYAAANNAYRLTGGLWASLIDEWWRGGGDPHQHGGQSTSVAGGPPLHPAWLGLFGVTRSGTAGFDSLRPRDAYFALAQEWGGAGSQESFEQGPRAGAVRNAASPSDLLAPGGLFSVQGEHLADEAHAANSADLPYELGATSVCAEGLAAPLYFVSPDEVRAQLPWEVPLGDRSLVVYRSGRASQAAVVPVAAYAPGIFEDGVLRPGLPCPVSSLSGIHPGDYLEVYGTGLGPVEAVVTTGAATTSATSSEGVNVVNRPQASVNGRDADVVFSGLLVGAPGVYQTNVRVPLDLAPGVVELRLAQGAVVSNVVAVQILGQDAEPSLWLSALEPGQLLLQSGGPARETQVRIESRDGFCELVRFAVSGLPPGVRASIPVGFPGAKVALRLWAEADAPRAEDAAVMLSALSSRAQATRRDLRVTVLPSTGDRRFRVVSGGWLSGSPLALFEADGRVIHEVRGGGPGRGFNFLVIDQNTGTIEPARNFDTWASDEAVEAMEQYLRQLPLGRVVLAAVADDGALRLRAETRSVLREVLGAQLVDALAYQYSWAIISRAGATRPISENVRARETVVLETVLTFPFP